MSQTNYKPGGKECYHDLEYASLDWFIIWGVEKYSGTNWIWRPYYGRSHTVIEIGDAYDIKSNDGKGNIRSFWNTWKKHKEKMKEIGFRVIKLKAIEDFWMIFIEYDIFEKWLLDHFEDPLIQRGFSFLDKDRIKRAVESKQLMNKVDKDKSCGKK